MRKGRNEMRTGAFRSALRAAMIVALAMPLVAAAGHRPVKIKAAYPEGPAVIGRAVYWVEMPLDRVRALEDGRVSTVWSSPGCGPTAVQPTRQGDIWILCHLGAKVLLLDRNWHLKKEVSYTSSGTPITWPNDGTVDSSGNIYVSSSGIFNVHAPATGTVVRIAPNGSAETIAGPFHYTNGVALNQGANELFLSEHLERRIWVLRLKDGKVTEKHVFFDFAKAGLSRPEYPEAGPDGQWLAPSGDLYVAEYGAGRIIHIDPNGKLKGVISVPTLYVTDLVPAPYDATKFFVTGTFDNRDPAMHGLVFDVKRAF